MDDPAAQIVHREEHGAWQSLKPDRSRALADRGLGWKTQTVGTRYTRFSPAR